MRSSARQNGKMQAILDDAQALDLRRQEQINNQVNAINRILGRLFSIAAVVNRSFGTSTLAGDNARRIERYDRVRELVNESTGPGFDGLVFVTETRALYTVDSAEIVDRELVITLKPHETRH
jgi:hypothetical protein